MNALGFGAMGNWKNRKRMWRRVNEARGLRAFGGAVIGLLLLASAGCASVDEWGRAKVYRPTAIADQQVWLDLLATRPDVRTTAVAVGEEGGQVTVLDVPADDGAGGLGEVRVLYLHGTFRHAFRNLPKTAPMAAAGMEVFLPDYRGWGVSSPLLPSEPSIHEDALAVWQALQKLPPRHENGRPVRWVIYGHSMGSAVAVALAERVKTEPGYCALVLESSFTNFSDVAYAAAGLLGRGLVAMGKQRMDAEALVANVNPPVWVLHGENDTTVPMYLGRRLFELAPAPKTWVQWPLAHSNLHTDPTGRYEQVWRDIYAACTTPSA
jgi:pimeloyl-ACP methyl ester carboxylesterase